LRSAVEDLRSFASDIAEDPDFRDAAIQGATLNEILSKGDRYIAKIPPDILGRIGDDLEKMRKEETNLWNGSIRRAGGNKAIKAQANFDEVNVTREQIEGLRSAAIHAQIKQVVEKLEELSDKVDRLLEGQHSDRIAKVRSGIKTYQIADRYQDDERKESQLANAQQSLQVGREELGQWLRDTLDKEVGKPEGLLDQTLHLVFGINHQLVERLNELEEKESQIHEALQYHNLASAYIFKIQAVQGEYDAAERSINQHIQSTEEIHEILQDKTIPLPEKTIGLRDELNSLSQELQEAKSEPVHLEFPASALLGD
jgi:uncharacterized phage infection (PIP) family protein YhgE